MTTTQHATTNLDDVKDLAPDFGMSAICESRFARQALGAETIGLANYRMNPGQRLGFGHSHGKVEEIYVVLAGSGRFKLDDEIIDVGPKDVVFCPPSTMREWESGPDGMELLAFGGHAEEEATMEKDWWTD
jgi:mannose-6-phosphate isomerase-like protein (cupin superfamily)